MNDLPTREEAGIDPRPLEPNDYLVYLNRHTRVVDAYANRDLLTREEAANDEQVRMAMQPNLYSMRDAWNVATPCVCDVAYTDRGLQSPHCWNHVSNEELIDLWRGGLKVTDNGQVMMKGA